MIDPRVTHLWDTGNVIGQEFLERFGVDFGGLDYDFFLLFDRDATWTQRPPRAVSSGATVIGDSDRLATTRRRCCAEALLISLEALAAIAATHAMKC